MGVRGFTTYMSKHSHLFHESLELKNCYIVIDGSGVAINLYVWHTRSNDYYGGDYDNYSNTVYKFFNLLKKCNITPIILFDGGYENRKLRTVFSRMRSRICSIKKMNSSSGKNITIYPLFTKEIFQDIALSLGIKCIRNDHESDSEVACLGRYLDCPILGYDSDFYFFDTVYIPFDKFEMRTVGQYIKETKSFEHHIPCEMYRIDNFLNHFGGLDKTNLPLLPVLLGNDYVKKNIFSAFYKHVKLKKSKSENDQQRLIKTVIYWLQHETFESAVAKILGRFKAKRRRFISFKLKSAMKGYLQVSSTIIECLEDIGVTTCKEENDINILNIEPTFEDGEEESNSDASDCDNLEDSSELSEMEISELDENNDCDLGIDFDSESPETVSSDDSCFIEKYRQCLLPQCFADIKWKNMYFCLPLIENYVDPNSHKISLRILVSIHKILNPLKDKPLICIWRCEDTSIKREKQEVCKDDLPNLSDIQKLDKYLRKLYFFEILNIDETYQKFLDMFPSDWHLFLISLYYWKEKSEKVIDTSYIYSMIICAIVRNFVDSKIGFCRSPKAFARKYKVKNVNALKSTNVVPPESIIESLENIEYDESVLCLRALLNYFCLQPKKPIDKRLNEASVVGYYSEFQSCALHIKYLNALLCFPFENMAIWNFFSGTFLYNSVVDFRRRSNLKSYIEILFKDCTTVIFSLQLIMKYIEQYFGEISESDAKKRRKKKKAKQGRDD
ncbi:protein asteroid [Coccinella septempunctata]|uniref:protein asteroid n=1 Tax=Coccinella septempunctata TaxID=41139 RepID=UPI001D0752B7|nr:protein asteroid [Coccinella septempunctata]